MTIVTAIYYLIIIRESIDFNTVNIHHAVGNLGSHGANPSGNLSVLGGCISQYIPPLGSVRIKYLQRNYCTVSICQQEDCLALMDTMLLILLTGV